MAVDVNGWVAAQIHLIEQARDACQLALQRMQSAETRTNLTEGRANALEQRLIERHAAIEALIGANVPEHQFDGTLFRLRNPDGSWGAWVDLLSPLAGIRDQVLIAHATVVAVGAQVTLDAAAAVTAAGQAAADRAIVTADKNTVAADKAAVAADKATVAADKAIVAADKATVAADKAAAQVAATAAIENAAIALAAVDAIDPLKLLGVEFTIDYDFSAPEAIRYNNFARGGTLGTYEDARGLITPSYGLRVDRRNGILRGALIEEASSGAINHTEALTAGNGWGGAALTLDGAKANPAGGLGCYYPTIVGETLKTFDGLNATMAAISFFAAKRTGTENYARLQPWQQIDGGGVFDVATFSFNFDAANPDQANLKNVRRIAYPNGWYRFAAQILPRAVGAGVFTASSRIDIEGAAGNMPYFWGVQVEPGKAEASSYMPASGTNPTRAADILLLSGADFAQQVRPEAGTVFVSGEFGPVVSGNQMLACFSDGTTNERTLLYRRSTDRHVVGIVRTGNVDVMSIDMGVVNDNAPCNITMRWRDGHLAGALNGAALVTAAGGNPSRTVNQLRLGANQSGISVLSGALRRYAYSPTPQMNDTVMREASAL